MILKLLLKHITVKFQFRISFIITLLLNGKYKLHVACHDHVFFKLGAKLLQGHPEKEHGLEFR